MSKFSALADPAPSRVPTVRARAETGGSEDLVHSTGFLFVCFVCRVFGWPFGQLDSPAPRSRTSAICRTTTPACPEAATITRPTAVGPRA